MIQLSIIQHAAGLNDESRESGRRGIELVNKVLATGPHNSFKQRLAHFLLTSPVEELRDYAKALQMATELVESVPEDPNVQKTFGIALYRTGEYENAIEPLNKYSEEHDDGETFFFLSMAHHQVGSRDKGLACFNQGAKWIKDRHNQNPNLMRLQSEAAELFEMDQSDSSITFSANVCPGKANSIQ